MEIPEYFVYCGIFITQSWSKRSAQIAKGEFFEVPCCLRYMPFVGRGYDPAGHLGRLSSTMISETERYHVIARPAVPRNDTFLQLVA